MSTASADIGAGLVEFLHANREQRRGPIEHDSVDVAVIGGGFAGLFTAARLLAAGKSTIVLESHALAGGFAGYFRRKGFTFDVGATTLVDFEPEGVGGEFLAAIGMEHPAAERLPGYVAWLPDRSIELPRDREQWRQIRRAQITDSPAHRRFWALLDQLADVFWQASRDGIKLPIQNPGDVWQPNCCGKDSLRIKRGC